MNENTSTQPDSTLKGVLTALVTPMDKGSVCFEDFDRLIELQIEQGINGLVPVGTTGESPTLDHGEHNEVIQHAVKQVNGRVPVIAGTGSNSTKEAVALTQSAHDAGVDGMLVVAPYYNKPTPEGLFHHFSAVAEATDKPIVLYSIFSRCGIEIDIDTIGRLAERFPHVRTIKEAGGSCDRVSEMINAFGDDFTVLSGDDSLTLPFMSVGAKGVISVASNLIPGDLVAMVDAALTHDFVIAGKLHRKYYPLFRDLFVESNPVPIKYTLHRAGIIRSPEVRLPLYSLGDSTKEKLEETLSHLG